MSGPLRFKQMNEQMLRFAVVAASVQLAVTAGSAVVAEGQPLSFTASALKTTYGTGDYEATRGDWQAEGVLRYHSHGLFRIGIGAQVGKFDEPYSDPSFTFVGVFVEPALGRAFAERWCGSLAARYGWAHERVGEEVDGLWAWGWQAGLVAGLDYRIAAHTAVGVQLDATHLSLERDEGSVIPPSGLDRKGWRYGLGLTLRFGGRR